ncbi:bifunctional riboflavin kinase/FAD synthetase [Helicobacter sp. MIT 14-3879]|uniref:bifunctional riboflavin kinase/FAD synthetase n=1 Tax=Helicobacter sp. MIT 14-3879 TaxID=2040649 RepID=UPI000E1FB446|nr:bifunctional riboflavin kinase/FAD synthetase [Helicobacter sp. MIT 14-3879]RDU63539.1 bifunctional riboflavin kinase/FAD synthetase [Helicobacter sp. MIT 14-3879]
MKKFSSISKKNNITNITIGKFDSIHLAHQAIFDSLDKFGIVIFIKTKTPKIGSIVPYKKKNTYISNPMYYIEFEKIKNLNGKKFLKYLISKLPNLRTIIVGVDFRFGKDKQYGAMDIPRISHLNVVTFKEMKIDNIPIHSSYIRAFILNGQIDLANKLLGRFYSIDGRVIKGQGIGSIDLFPTININADEYILPKDGVYATQTRIGNKLYKSISFIGNRLSTNMSFAIESHIIDKYINFKPKKIEIFFIERIRDNKKFNSFDGLKKQISIDIKKSKEILKYMNLK